MKIIARIRSDFPTKFGIPRQSGRVEELTACIVFEPEYRVREAVKGLEEMCIRDRIYTPKVSCGLLPGILREYLCDTEEVEETYIYVQDLKWYEECFVTNSLMGIMPVRQIGGIRFEEDKVTRELMRRYRKMVRDTANKKQIR